MTFVNTDQDVRELLAASHTIAVVGLSDKPSRTSHRVSRYMQGEGYTIIPVNPAITHALGVRAYPDLKSVPEPIDIVNIFRRPEFVPDIIEAAIAVKAKAVWMQLGIVHPAAARRASDAGLNVVMDQCIMIEHSRLMFQG
jgi:predicted CoA-binding protein